jgi:hypothetical protein
MTVFHPGHDALHGFTVLVLLKDGRAACGRYDRVEGGKLLLLDACASTDAPEGAAPFLDRLRREGPRAETPRLFLSEGDVASVRPFGEWLRA